MEGLAKAFCSLFGFLCSFLLFTGLFCFRAIAQGEISLQNKVVDAINCGGDAHEDIYGIRYRRDPLEGITGIASDYGRRFLMQRVPKQDQILYQTERYDTDSFGYELDVKEEGSFVLVLKFSEVYFTRPNQKIFDVVINDQDVLTDLDIFEKVGQAIAHDEVIPFSVKDGKLKLGRSSIDFSQRTLRVQFRKGSADNPKINALYIIKGKENDVPPLPPVAVPEEEEEKEEKVPETEDTGPSPHASGPKAADPWAAQMDPSQTFLPILIALACFFPVLFCLCKL